MKKLMPLLTLIILLSGCWRCVPASLMESSGTVDRSTPPATQTVPDSPISSAEASPPLRTPAPTSEKAKPAPAPVPSPTPTPVPTPTPASGADELANKTTLVTYEKTEEAWGWSETASVPLDRDDWKTVGKQVYCRVGYPGIKTLADLWSYLKSLFSDGLVEGLLPVDGTQCVGLGGALYTIDGGCGVDIIKGEETVQVLRNGTSGRCTVRVTVEVLDPQQRFSMVGSETHDFPYEQVRERWIFTTLSMVRQGIGANRIPAAL